MPMTEYGDISVSYRGDEASQMFFEPVFFDDDLRQSYTVMPGVTTRRKMQFIRPLENIIRRKTGCGFNPIGGLNVYDRFVEVERMAVNMELCMEDFLDSVWEELLATGTRMPDLRGTQIEQILIQRVQQAIRLDVERIIHFGDLSSADPNYDQLDGLWTVHYPALVADNLIPRFNTSSGSALGAGAALTAIRTVYDNAPNELLALPDSMKVFNVTAAVYRRLLQDYEDDGGGDVGFLMQMNESGTRDLMFRGIPVRPQYRWDTILEALNGAANQNYIEFTTPRNKVIATDAQGINPGSDLSIWYDDKDEKVYVKAIFKMGTNYVHPSLISVGY